MKILAVDDSQTMLLLIRKTLDALGYSDAVYCDSTDAALEALEQQKIDLILLDWHMPGLTGLDCLRLIKNTVHLKAIPVIMLTVEEHPRSIQEALDSGASAYMVKPFNAEVFQKVLTEISANHSLQ